jgi:hypothetical protein
MYVVITFIILIFLFIFLSFSIKEKFNEDKIYEIKIKLKDGTEHIYQLKHADVCNENQCEFKIKNDNEFAIDINEIDDINILDGEKEIQADHVIEKKNKENLSILKCNENNYNLGLYNKYKKNNEYNYEISKVPNVSNLNQYFFDQNSDYNKLLEKLNKKNNFNYYINLL